MRWTHPLDAVRWAAEEAARRRCPVRIVHAREWPPQPYIGDEAEWARRLAPGGATTRTYRSNESSRSAGPQHSPLAYASGAAMAASGWSGFSVSTDQPGLAG